MALSTLVVAAGPAAAIDGLHLDATTTYRLDVEAGVVHTEIRARLTNTIPPRTRGGYVETAYFDRIALPVVGPVDDVTATGPGGALSTSVRTDADGVELLTIELSPRLLHERPQDIVVRYSLPGQAPRSEAVTRVNEAYAAWYVTAHGDPGDADLRIELPRDFELAIAATPAELETERTSDAYVITPDGTQSPEDLFFAISVLREDALVDATVELDDATVVVRSWPGDDEWRAFAADLVERGIPTLTDLVGRPLPDPTLTVLETSGGTHLGYAGFFEQDGTIEVSDAMDGETLLHELAHTWVNVRLFSERWLIEGMTQEVARRAATRLDVDVEDVPELDVDAAVATPLNQWGPVAITDEDRHEHEEWGYDTSYHVVHALVDDLDDAELAQVLGTALDSLIAYPGDPEPERVVIRREWRYVLDLLQEAGVPDAVELYRAHVVTPAQARELDDRAEARSAYAELVDRSGSWTPPFPLREAMATWDFDDVTPLVARADELRERAAGVGTALTAVGSDLPEVVETTYEATEDLGEVEDLLARLETITASLEDLERRAEEVRVLGRIGLLGSEGDLLARAAATTSTGDLDAADELLAREDARLAGAARTGAVRLGIGAAGLLVLLAAVLVLRRRRRGGDGA